MGLLDSVLGAVISGQQNNAAPQQGGGLNVAALLPVLAPIVMNMLSNNSAQGGAQGLMDKFSQAGLGDVLGSWIGTGQNQPISADQISNVLGSDTVGNIASQLGLGQGDAAGVLSQLLPTIVDQLTPNGQVPQGGFGSGSQAGDLMGMLGGLLQKR